MFLNELELLEAFDVDAEEIGKLREFLDCAVSRSWTRVTPVLFARLCEMDDVRATELLFMSGEELHLLTTNFEVECPLCSQSHFTVSDPSEVPDEERYCQVEDEFYVPDPDLIWLTFDPTEELTRKKKLLLRR